MKNRMAQMIGASFGLSFDTAAPAAGGGTAVAAPPAAAAPAPAVAAPVSAPAAAAPSAPPPTKTGFFKDLPRAVSAPDKSAPIATKPVADGASKPFKVMSDDGKTVLGEFSSQTEAEAHLKTLTAEHSSKPTVAAVPPAAVDGVANPLPRPIMGRFKTDLEVEEYIRQSGQEASRLASENKTLKESTAKALADREAELTVLKSEFEAHKATPAVPDLSKEDLAKLWKEDPAQAAEYVQQKYDRDRNAQAVKERAVREASDRRENLIKTNEAITRNIEEMSANPKVFPKFQEMLPRMSEILNRTGGDKSPLRGQVWANELAYKAALGDIYQELLLAGTEVKADAAQAARLKADSDAAALNAGKGDGGGSGSVTVVDSAKAEEKSWRAAVRASSPKPFLKERS
jgi:hypothetical protein